MTKCLLFLRSSPCTEPGTYRDLSLFLPRFTPSCCPTGFGIWILLNNSNIFFLSLSLSLFPPLSTPGHEKESFGYLHFYAWVYFSSGNRNSVSGVDSQRCCVLECISLPFHLHPSLTAFCFSLAISSVPPSIPLTVSAAFFNIFPQCYANFLCSQHWTVCLVSLHPALVNFPFHCELQLYSVWVFHHYKWKNPPLRLLLVSVLFNLMMSSPNSF